MQWSCVGLLCAELTRRRQQLATFQGDRIVPRSERDVFDVAFGPTPRLCEVVVARHHQNLHAAQDADGAHKKSEQAANQTDEGRLHGQLSTGRILLLYLLVDRRVIVRRQQQHRQRLVFGGDATACAVLYMQRQFGSPRGVRRALCKEPLLWHWRLLKRPRAPPEYALRMGQLMPIPFPKYNTCADILEDITR
jgi:hypothetical protein